MSDTRQKLIRCAMDLFGRNGFHAIGLDAILNAVGVSKQTFYNHFESKDDLMLAVLAYRREVERQLFERLYHEIAGDDPRDRLYAIFDVLEAWFNQPDWRGCIFITAAAEFPLPHEPAHQAAARVFRENREYIRQLAIGSGADDPDLLADRLMLLVEGVINAQHITRQSHFVDVARTMATALLDQHLAPAAAR